LTYPRRGGYVDAVRDLSDFSEKERFVTQIYVGNLAYGATEDELRQAFGEYGQVSAVNIITDRQTGRPRGFAFVEMPNAAEAKKAIESLNLQEIAGRAVTVNEARPKTDSPHQSGGGGRDRRSW
jgi:RNA recognition motif-containing protein